MVGENMDFWLKKNKGIYSNCPLPSQKKKKKSGLLQLTKMQKEEKKKTPKACEEEGEGAVAFSCP